MRKSLRLASLVVLGAIGIAAGTGTFAMHDHYALAVALAAAFFAADGGYWRRVPDRNSSES